MAQTYCGKDCTACEYRESMGCYGCKAGPGRLIYGDCEIAKCCRAKGHADCSTCVQKDYCGQLKSCHRMPEYRRKKQETEERLRATLLRRAPFFAKWLAVLFWLFIPTNIVSLLNNDFSLQLFPGLLIPSIVLGFLCAVARAVVLLILSKEDHHYGTAGIIGILAGIVEVCTALIDSDVALILLLLLAAALTIVGLYQEYQGHIHALYVINDILSQKWADLLRWELICLALTMGGALCASLIPLLPLLALLVGLIGSIVVGIMRLIYLYQSAKAFREYALEGAVE